MNYSEQYFGKPLRTLTAEDIKDYFSGDQEETETIEFKSLGKETLDATLNKHVFRTVSAFLNSSGGILILGSPTHKDKFITEKKTKIFQGDLTPTVEFIEKDTLINRISRNISYMPIGINIQVIEIEKKYIYIIEVQESNSKPHQYNGSYFIRLDGQSNKAPHYLVDAFFNRITFPDLIATVKFKNNRVSTMDDNFSLSININIDNNSNYVNAKQIGIIVQTNTGYFSRNGLERIFYNHDGVLAKGMIINNEYELILPKDTINQNVIIDVQFYSEHSPLKVSTYEIKIDSKNPVIEWSLENEEAHVAMEMLKNLKEDTE